jgi:predicted nuclease of predicted toxin-antitoxin system
MNLSVDDNSADAALVAHLKKDGHRVVIPSDSGLVGAPDPQHFEYAIVKRLIVLTADRDDFRDLHRLVLAAGGAHPGLLVIRYDNDPKRDMKPKHIVRAIRRLEKSGTPVANQMIVLNHWR